MIYSLKGQLILTEPVDTYYNVVVECAGVGYGIRTTHNTVLKLPKINNETKLFTYLHVREDALDLFGFADLEELNCFKMLISVSGVGPKMALSILSDVTPQKFALYIATGDSKSITRSKGVGAKTAQRIVLELKDKVSKQQMADGILDTPSVSLDKSNNLSEAVSALVVLGYSQSEAVSCLSKLEPNTSVEDMIKHGLKALSSQK